MLTTQTTTKSTTKSVYVKDVVKLSFLSTETRLSAKHTYYYASFC
jgi:hypothetical protein